LKLKNKSISYPSFILKPYKRASLGRKTIQYKK
jgi:hypothetical protein